MILHIMKMKRIIEYAVCGLAAAAMAASCCSNGCHDGSDTDVRISWDCNSYTEMNSVNVSNAGYVEKNLCYPRIKRLSDGSLLMSFMDQHYGPNIYVRRSEDNGRTWSDAILLKHWYDAESTVGKDEVHYVNPDFIELQDGRIMIAYQWRYRYGYSDIPNTNNNCGVEIMFSEDKGKTWGESREIYRGRCWEPAMLQLPDGEIQMYITSSQDVVDGVSYPRTMLIRSFDGGKTWQGKEMCGIDDNEAISRTIDGRFAYDGMPTGVYLDDGQGIVVPLEVWHGSLVMDQTPIIVRTDLKTNWRFDQKKILEEGGPDFPDKKEVNKDFQGYGPYGCKIGTGEVLVLSNGTYKGVEGIWTFIGDRKADNFYHATSPFTGYWGSIDYVGDNKVIATGSEKYRDEDGKIRYRVKAMTGRLNYSKTLAKGGLGMVPIEEFDRESNGCWFLGKAGESSVFADFGYTDSNFEVGTYIFDRNIVSFTPENSDAAAVLVSRGKPGCYENWQIISNAEGKFIVYKEFTRSWHKVYEGTVPVDLSGSVNYGSDTDLGYAVKVSVPWDILGGKPSKGEVLRAHLRHYYKDNVKEKPLSLVEDQEGENTDYPQEWLKLILK